MRNTPSEITPALCSKYFKNNKDFLNVLSEDVFSQGRAYLSEEVFRQAQVSVQRCDICFCVGS